MWPKTRAQKSFLVQFQDKKSRAREGKELCKFQKLQIDRNERFSKQDFQDFPLVFTPARENQIKTL